MHALDLKDQCKLTEPVLNYMVERTTKKGKGKKLLSHTQMISVQSNIQSANEILKSCSIRALRSGNLTFPKQTLTRTFFQQKLAASLINKHR